MKYIALLFTFFTISFTSYSQSSVDEKIIEMMELSGSSKSYDALILRLMEYERVNNTSMSDEFWDKAEDSFLTSTKARMYEMLVPIYAKYLSEEDLDQIIAFYKSPAGENLVNNMPNILNESMNIGQELGEELGVQIYNEIKANKLERFNAIYNGCEEAKTGNFVFQKGDLVVHYTRTKKQQTESYKNIVSKYEIKWLDDCRYVLKLISSNDPNRDKNDDVPFIVNISSCDKDGFHYLGKNEDSDQIMEGDFSKEY